MATTLDQVLADWKANQWAMVQQQALSCPDVSHTVQRGSA